MKSAMRTGMALGAVVLAGGCAPVVKSSYLRPDYEQVDRTQTKRLAIVIAPQPDNNPKAAELWALLTKRTLRLKRDYIVKESAPLELAPGQTFDLKTFDPKSKCAEGIEGVLWIAPTMVKEGAGYQTSLTSKLVRCRDGEEVWNAVAQGRWDSRDEGLKEVTARYVTDVGPEVEPYVVPTHRIVKALVDALPQVTLSDKDKDEKIEVEASE